MSETHFANANSFGNEIVELLERYKKLKTENAQLKENLADLQNKLDFSKAEEVKLKSNYGRLKIAKVYGWDEENKRLATDKITRLIRDIDKCLNELNDLDV